VLLTTAVGRCIRFPVDDVRVFAGRESTGVRGIRMAEGDTVISMAILRAVAASPAEREAYLKHANAMRAAANAEPTDAEEPSAPDEEAETVEGQVSLSLERIAELGAAEEFVLTVSSEGFGKRTSAYDYRRTGRGGQGLIAHDLTKRGGRLVASFPVEESDELLLVSDQGQLIRVRVAQVRIAARNTQGVTIFRKADDEHVVSVERIEGGAADEDDGDEAPEGPEAPTEG
jgi:DNA gyrase subunit A